VQKIQSSGQRIEYFEQLQIQCRIAMLLKIPLHSNTRWGSAYNMLDRAYHLCQVLLLNPTFHAVINLHIKPIKLFITAADELFGPITVICREGQIEKQIRWGAFQLKEADWACVVDAKAILAVRS
jgi:hypothetical protein